MKPPFTIPAPVTKVIRLFFLSWNMFRSDYLYLHAGALAFFTVLSFPPILVVIIFMASKFYNPMAVQDYIYNMIGAFMGRDGALQLAESIDRLMVAKPKVWTAILGALTLVFISTTVFNSIKNSLNFVFKVPRIRGKQRWIQLIVKRFISLGIILIIAAVILLSLIASTFVKLSVSMIPAGLSVYFGPLHKTLAIIIPFIILSLVFSMLFKWLPDIYINIKQTLLGGIVTAILFSIGKYVISYIIVNGQVSGFYDAAGSIMALMLWAYYSSIIFLFGACFTKIMTTTHNKDT